MLKEVRLGSAVGAAGGGIGLGNLFCPITGSRSSAPDHSDPRIQIRKARRRLRRSDRPKNSGQRSCLGREPRAGYLPSGNKTRSLTNTISETGEGLTKSFG